VMLIEVILPLDTLTLAGSRIVKCASAVFTDYKSAIAGVREHQPPVREHQAPTVATASEALEDVEATTRLIISSKAASL